MRVKRRRRCLSCKELFRPDARNFRRQRFCSMQQCRNAAKAARQRRWLAKPENQDYFCGPEHVERVRRWQQANPGYSKRSSRRKGRPLQDLCPAQAIDLSKDSGLLVLQDLCRAPSPVIIGLIAHLSDSTLQDDILATSRRLLQLGQDVRAGTAKSAPGNTV
jgi:hypothetical protein